MTAVAVIVAGRFRAFQRPGIAERGGVL